jgi:tripartite-type tricarboxylate transporter receptor subunit TctC
VLSAWWVVFLPSGVPVAVRDKLIAMITAALRSLEFTKQAATLRLDLMPIAGREFSQKIAGDNAEWKQLIESSKIRLD